MWFALHLFVNFGLNPRDLSILQHTFVYSIVFPVLGHQHSQPGCLKFNQSLFLFVLCPIWRKVVSGAFNSGIPWAPLCQSLQARGKKKASSALGDTRSGSWSWVHVRSPGPQVCHGMANRGWLSIHMLGIHIHLFQASHFTSFYIILLDGCRWMPINHTHFSCCLIARLVS